MIGLLLAATAVTPIAAQAQSNDQPVSDRQRAGREAYRQSMEGGNRRQQIQERQERREQPAQAQQQPAAVAPARIERNDDRRDDRAGRREERRDARIDDRNDRRADWAQHREERRDDRAERRDDRRDDRRQWNDVRRDDRRDDRRDVTNDRRDGRDWNNDRRDANRDWNRDWRNDRRYGWQDYRQGNRNIYRVPRYSAPRGYSYNYRRWSPGYRIDPWFYGQSYWISDPWAYRLPPVWGDYRWVRYYDDVILIDIRTGLIRDIIYDFFWR